MVVRGSTRGDLYILLGIGLKPKTLITLGFPESTVYRYSAKMDSIRKNMNRVITDNVHTESKDKKPLKSRK